MDRNEFGAFAALLKTAYPRENLLPNQAAMEMWFRMLRHIPYQLAELLLQKWMGTNKWPPTVSEILDGYNELKGDAPPDWSEGWKEVQDAISHYGYVGEEEAYASFSPITAKVVARLDWQSLCMSDNPAADRANFRTCYETLYRREREDRQLPPALKEAIRQCQIGGTDGVLLRNPRQSDHQEKLAANGQEQGDGALVPHPVQGV